MKMQNAGSKRQEVRGKGQGAKGKITFYFWLLASGFWLLASGSSFAGDYHKAGIPAETTLACAQCHVMHGTQGGTSLIYSGGVNTYAKLLRDVSVVNLCKYCHDGDPVGLGAPDLFSPIYNASAGDFNTGGTPNEDKRHSIGVDLTGIRPPGYDQSWTEWTTAQSKYGSVFSCIYCHDQHGNSNYRNFRPEPLDPSFREPGSGTPTDPYKIVTYNNGAWDGISSIAQAIIDGNADGSNPANQYSTSNMTFRSNTKQIANFCGKCHVKFYNSNGYGGDDSGYGMGKLGGSVTGDSGTGTQWVRHPVGGISVGVGNGHTDTANFTLITGSSRARVINPDGADTGSDEQPFCLTCHRSHGSSNHSNLIFGAPTASGGAGTKMRDTCQQCHNQ